MSLGNVLRQMRQTGRDAAPTRRRTGNGPTRLARGRRGRSSAARRCPGEHVRGTGSAMGVHRGSRPAPRREPSPAGLTGTLHRCVRRGKTPRSTEGGLNRSSAAEGEHIRAAPIGDLRTVTCPFAAPSALPSERHPHQSAPCHRPTAPACSSYAHGVSSCRTGTRHGQRARPSPPAPGGSSSAGPS